MLLEKMSYDSKSGTVIYRSKMHLGLKRNFQVMSGAEWLELSNRAEIRVPTPEVPPHLPTTVSRSGWFDVGSPPAWQIW